MFEKFCLGTFKNSTKEQHLRNCISMFAYGYLFKPSLSDLVFSIFHKFKSNVTSKFLAANEKLFFEMKLVRIVEHSSGTVDKKWVKTDSSDLLF